MRALVALALLASAGCAGPSGPVLLEDSRTVEGKGFLELDVWLDGAVHWTWEAEAPAGFNIHSHGSAGTVNHVEQGGTQGNGTFDPPSPGGYSLMWINPGVGSSQVTYRVEFVGRA